MLSIEEELCTSNLAYSTIFKRCNNFFKCLRVHWTWDILQFMKFFENFLIEKTFCKEYLAIAPSIATKCDIYEFFVISKVSLANCQVLKIKTKCSSDVFLRKTACRCLRIQSGIFWENLFFFSDCFSRFSISIFTDCNLVALASVWTAVDWKFHEKREK